MAIHFLKFHEYLRVYNPILIKFTPQIKLFWQVNPQQLHFFIYFFYLIQIYQQIKAAIS